MNRTTTVKLFGGLGNQIFQVMAGIFVSELRNTSLILDVRWIDRNYGHQNSHIMDFDWSNFSNFKLRNGILSKIEMESLNVINSLIYRNVFPSKALGYLTNIDILDMSPWITVRNVKLLGYFQDTRIWDNVRESHDMSFTLRNTSINYQELDATFKNEFISIHIRGGDFLKNSSFYKILNRDYYDKAINFALNSHPDLPLVVFTDDEVHARGILAEIRGKQFTVIGKNMSAAENMKLMSKAKVIITANSTFSLWAGMIAKDCNLFLTPKNWYIKRERVTSNLVPQNWIRL